MFNFIFFVTFYIIWYLLCIVSFKIANIMIINFYKLIIKYGNEKINKILSYVI